MLLTEEHEKFRSQLKDLLRSEVIPEIERHEAEGILPARILRLFAQQGLLGIPYPKKYGGKGLDVRSYVIAVEEVSRLWGSLGLTLAAHTSLGTFPIYRFGTEEQKGQYFPRLAGGKTLGAFGLTEPNAGSDAGSTQTTARLFGEEYILNGSKIFITSAISAEIFVITAVTEKVGEKSKISAFIVEKGMPGFSVGRKEDKLGLRSSETCSLILEDCRVPKKNLLGREGEGFKIFLTTLDGGRISIGAMAVGLAQGAYEEAFAFARRSGLLGRSILEKQLVQGSIADMATDLAAARMMVYHGAYLEDTGKRYTLQGAMAKLFASEACMRIVNRAVELMGTEGVTDRSAVGRFFRDAKLTTIGEGTSEVQRMVIAREIAALADVGL